MARGFRYSGSTITWRRHGLGKPGRIHTDCWHAAKSEVSREIARPATSVHTVGSVESECGQSFGAEAVEVGSLDSIVLQCKSELMRSASTPNQQTASSVVGVHRYGASMSLEMNGADDHHPNENGDEPFLKSADEVRRTIQANQRASEGVFIPSPIIERLLWQVCGAWETVIEEVRFFHYILKEDPPTEPPFVYPDGENVARDMRRIAKKLNLRLPSDTIWTSECKSAKAMRDDLGHMLHFKAIVGETPDQTVTLLRVPYKEPDEMSTDGCWARHNRRTVTITEREAREVLAGLSYVRDSLFALRKFGVAFNTWPDDRKIDNVLQLLRWWLDEWGPQPGASGWKYPTMRQLRILPKAEYDASLPPSMRPEF